MKVRSAPGTDRAGFSILEALMMMTLLAIGLGGMASVLGFTTRLVHVDQQTTLAAAAATERIEVMQALDFGMIFARFNADPSDDPGAPGSAPGSGFAVPGLEPVPGDADGLVGEVLFPTKDLGGADLVLREDLVDARFGTPRDLNGDGAIDELDHTDDHVLLPVVVRLTWRSGTGRQVLELSTLLIEGL